MDSIKRLHGIYRGIVKDNRDPDNLRRLTLQVQTTGSSVTGWAWPLDSSSVTFETPTIGQRVWVSYVGGDPEYPVWHGTFGKHQGSSKKVFVKPLANSVSLTGLSSYLKTISQKDGTTEVDLTETILAMSNTLKSYETRISSLESQIQTLHTTLATRTSPSHTHGSNG